MTKKDLAYLKGRIDAMEIVVLTYSTKISGVRTKEQSDKFNELLESIEKVFSNITDEVDIKYHEGFNQTIKKYIENYNSLPLKSKEEDSVKALY